MRDEQLDRLAGVLRLGRIWAVNVGENFGTSQEVRGRACLLTAGSWLSLPS